MRKNSEAIYERSCNVIPGGVNSPVRAFKGLGIKPMIVESGSGDTIRDVDGKEYIDFCMSWGPLILGHAHPDVLRAANEQLAKGFSFGIATEVEEKLATKIVGLIPSVEKIRFVNSGTEAGMTALRLARGFTERPKIVKFTGHYHGHSDALLIQAGSGVAHINSVATSKGVGANIISDTICLPFNDFHAVRAYFQSEMGKNTAGVILEPVAGNMGVVPPEPGFLEMLREETEKAGALLIFDEVITGFRVALQGAQGLYQIDPDLTCFGKVIGGGFPVAAVGGKSKILNCLAPLGQVYQAGTLSGNPVAIRAGLEMLIQIEKPLFYERLQIKTDRLLNPIREIIQKKKAKACINQVGSMFTIFLGIEQVKEKSALDENLFAHFFRTLFELGIYIPPSSNEAWFISSEHTEEHIDFASRAISSYIEKNL